MARKLIRVSGRMLFTWFMLAGLIFLFAPRNLTNKFQFAFARAFRWPLSVGRSVSLFARTEPDLADAVSRRKYNQLQNHADNLAEALMQGRQKFNRLFGLYNRYVWDGVEFVVADVITASAEAPSRELIINSGQNDGLAKGQFVLGDNSVVGLVSDVQPHQARVRLITDSTSNLPVKIGPFRAVMSGSGADFARIPMAKHKVTVGQKVYAVKKPGFLDSPVKVGTVAACRTNDEHPLFCDITVKPACNIEGLESVAVVVINREN
jgi:cell shape-determining protein MreC